MTKRRSISSRRSSLLSSANSFIQRSYGKGELWTGAPKTPKLQDQNSANETKCVKLHWFSFSKIIRIFGLPKKYWCCKNGNGFFHLQWMESLPNLNPFGPPFRPDVHPAVFSLPGRRKKHPGKLPVTTLSSKMVVGRRCSFLGARPFLRGKFWVRFREVVPGSENLQSSNLQCLFQQRLLRHRRGLNFELETTSTFLVHSRRRLLKIKLQTAS